VSVYNSKTLRYIYRYQLLDVNNCRVHATCEVQQTINKYTGIFTYISVYTGSIYRYIPIVVCYTVYFYHYIVLSLNMTVYTDSLTCLPHWYATHVFIPLIAVIMLHHHDPVSNCIDMDQSVIRYVQVVMPRRGSR
jgi:hypothetical protein